MDPAFTNYPLRDLVPITELNRPVFDDFVSFLKECGHVSLYSFVYETNSELAISTLTTYFLRKLPTGIELLNGVGKPYAPDKAKWMMVGWILRDAPEQRLRPLLKRVEETSRAIRKAIILNKTREAMPYLPQDRWGWPSISEHIRNGLEGSRRAIRGNLFEGIVRRILADLFEEHGITLDICDGEIKIDNVTYDVCVEGPGGTILMPIKTRETQGGGHASLFTRDIESPIRLAQTAGYSCIPLIIAQSWVGDIESLNCPMHIYINRHPQEIVADESLLRVRLWENLDAFREIAVAGDDTI